MVVRFGDPNMEIKRDDARRKSFRARHNCADKKDKTTPGYWSCMQWNEAAQLMKTFKDFEAFSKVHTEVKTFL